ncbi:unnamed protein product [Chilo suppressalis]|uniref:Uncharacterized protein n=1 Tax=Chilo suppressalis TaxID=168631 RepID=A0ABN8EAX4_CHISP|nr:unnamed protein product [Chilo suppressalis]
MARVVVVAYLLATALLARVYGARYGSDYSLHMPAYGDDEQPSIDRDEYRAHSPDYKYEEDFKGKTEQSAGGQINEAESWRRSIRKQRRKVDDDFILNDEEKFEPDDDIHKAKSVIRFTKHRPRYKSHKFDENDDSPRFLKRRVRDRSNIVPELSDEREIRDDKDNFLDESKSLVNKNKQFTYRTKSVRARRRPRDRLERHRPSDDDEIEMREMGKERNLDIWPQLDQDQEIAEQRRLDFEGVTRPRLLAPIRPLEPPSGDEEPALVRSFQGKNQERSQYNDNYSDYYDMKRAMNVKNKLPSMRRTQVRQHLVPGPLARASTQLLANRRMLQPSTTRPSREPTTITRTEAASTTVYILPSTSTTTFAPTVHVKKDMNNNTKELSLAEKSRLSILKKVQRKESGRSELSTKKPPVLLQVTKRLPTVVMVEPPSSQQPWMRAVEIPEDSPQRLQKVRQLMRQKLLADARNIRDLTDNWDDVVCDYVDMSLLDNKACKLSSQIRSVALMLLFLLLLVR